jgi:hypothetical protein
MITFSLNTFIKICSLDTGGRISEIQKRLSSPGGYDFYKPLHGAVRAFCSGNPTLATSILAAPVNLVERNHNAAAYSSFLSKFGNSKSIAPLKHPKPLKFASAGISIAVDPLFEITKGGVRNIYCLWPTQSPALTQKYGAVACLIMRSAYSNSALANGLFHYADLVSNRVYSEKQITNNTSLILSADVNSIGTLVKEL